MWIPNLWLGNCQGNDFKCCILSADVRVVVIVQDVNTLLSKKKTHFRRLTYKLPFQKNTQSCISM